VGGVWVGFGWSVAGFAERVRRLRHREDPDCLLHIELVLVGLHRLRGSPALWGAAGKCGEVGWGGSTLPYEGAGWQGS
jgi:hypothetical protein